MTTPTNSADPGLWARALAAAELGARQLEDYYEGRRGAGVPIGTTGSDPVPVAVEAAGLDPAVTGVGAQ